MRLLCVSLIALAAAMPAEAQDGFPIEDQISVIGSVLERSPANQSLDRVEVEAIDAISPVSLVDVLRLSNAANITTNSRGETLVYLRNAGERQTALYFDGAALNIPWDNRINLAIIPADAIGALAVQSGPASSLYGVNAAGGVIEIDPLRAADSPAAGRIRIGFGDSGRLETSLRWTGETETGDWLVAAARLAHDDQPGRLNSDLSRTSLVARYHQTLGDSAYLSASLLSVNADFGIAPALFDRAAQGRPRYWRYPDARQLLLTARGGLAFSRGADLHATLWYQEYDQTIESFTSITYDTLDETQIDDDQAIGLRLLADWRDFAGGELRLSLTGLDTRHAQQEFAAGTHSGAPEVFADRRFSLGAEYERDLSDHLTLFAGASADRLDITATGGRPAGEGFETWNATAGLLVTPGDSWTLRPSLSRKARIPTLRELYGAALNRFLPNPDLEAETLTSVDLEIRHQGERSQWTFTPFVWKQDDTLDQINITVGSNRLRQRVNVEGASARGIEARFSTRLSNRVSIEGGLTAMRLRRDEPLGIDGERYLSERPELIARLAVEGEARPGLFLRTELDHRGAAYSFSDEDVFERLPASTALNLSARYSPTDAGWEIYARVDNATDAEIIPQLGLPAPGRWARVGIRVAFGS